MADEYQEYQRHYTDGWGIIPDPKTGVRNTFRAISFGDNYADLEILSRDEIPKLARYTAKHIMARAEWFYPESKYVNTPIFVVRCVAYPNRQFSKAMTVQNCYFAEATSLKYKEPISSLLKPTISDALIGYGETYPTYSECFNLLETGKVIGRAFSKRFMIANYPEYKYPLLIYKNSPMGYDRGDLIVITSQVEKLSDVISSLTNKGVTYESR